MSKAIKENKFNCTVLKVTVGATVLSLLLSVLLNDIFLLNENQLLYLFSTMAQITGGIFGLTLTAYVFFVDKFKESMKDEIHYDAAKSLLERYFHNLILIACISGTVVLLCAIGIISLHNWPLSVYSFIINESVFLFSIGVVNILIFGVSLLNPHKLDKEMANLTREVEEFYDAKPSDEEGDLGEFLRYYNLLNDVIIDFANKCVEANPKYNNQYKPQIISALNVLVWNEIISVTLRDEINELRKYRNGLVHGVDFSVTQKICNRVEKIYKAIDNLYHVFQEEGRESEEWEVAIHEVYALKK